ncbi:MAG: restriction endonuclease subunit S [Verrucomicrobiia bacterium]
MSTSWQQIALGDVLEVKHGWPFKSELFSETLTGKPIVVAVGNFQYTGGFRFDATTTKEYLGEYPRQYELKPRDILLVMTCQTEGGEILGIPARIPNDGKVYLHNQRLGKIVVTRPDLLDGDFIYWVFLWKDFNDELVASSSGTKIKHTAPSRIEQFGFLLPSLDEQCTIAQVLGALDDKIELNRRMNRTLEGLTTALFRSWFVDFDPVVAKAAGRKPAHLRPELAAQFPATFQDSPLGPIPHSWELKTIEDTARYVNGRAFTKGATGTGRMVIRIAELNSGPGGSTIYNDVAAAPGNVAQSGDLLFAWSGSLDVYRWYRDEAIINQHIFKVVCEKYPQWFVHQQLREAMPFFQDIAADKATTMGHIKREHLSQAFLALPPKDLLVAADKIFQPLYAKQLANERESLTLAALRDTLLPKLLSGELRVKQAERLVEAKV